jgi:hydrogenase maturation protease
MNSRPRILLIGYGNPGRLDDGLGPAVAAAAETWKLSHVTVDSDYQLTVEDAADIAAHDIVVLADASVNGREPFFIEAVTPVQAQSFSSHSVEPGPLLHMARSLFDGNTRGYILGIRGYEFNEFGERLSPRAQDNLRQALDFLRLALDDPRLLDLPPKEEMH